MSTQFLNDLAQCSDPDSPRMLRETHQKGRNKTVITHPTPFIMGFLQYRARAYKTERMATNILYHSWCLLMSEHTALVSNIGC
eukprot:4171798-Amphidinium_carterae.1